LIFDNGKMVSFQALYAELIPHNASAQSLVFWDLLRGTNPEVSQLNLTEMSKRKWRLSAPSLSTETT
jgi:hypothetical protein